MLGPLNIVLENFGVSARNGFLPDELPLRRLSIYYSAWEDIVARLPNLLQRRSLRGVVDTLPLLSTSELLSESEWQRAYVLLSFLAHGYIWGGERPSERLPAAISAPFLKVSSHLGLPPTAAASAQVLWNFTSRDTDLTKIENLSSLHTFTGTKDEEWFYLISVAIEARGAKVIPIMLRAMDAVRLNNAELVSQCLLEFADCVEDVGIMLERMNENCSPDIFYHQIRPLLAGSKNMSAAGLPKGVFYEDEDGKGEWHQHSGGSNAQSSLIQFLDIVLGVEHHPTKSSGAEPKGKHGFLQEMREYMPGGHRRFLEHIESVANIREYVQTSTSGEQVTAAYNLAVARLGELRDTHIKIVTRYIIGPSRRAAISPSSGLNLAIASTNRKSADALPGTGGTVLIPFLKQTRDETKATSLS